MLLTRLDTQQYKVLLPWTDLDPLSGPWIESSDFMFDSQLHYLLHYLLVNWNQGHEWEIALGHVTDDTAHGFLCIDARDQFLWKVARFVETARDNGVAPTRFSTVNTATSDSPGFHWVSIVNSIEKIC